ncbi:hypothetical protein ES705_42590 [subsurface metagenome]
MNSLEPFLQYGIAGLCLYMMYSITYNHLIRIEELLTEILNKLP